MVHRRSPCKQVSIDEFINYVVVIKQEVWCADCPTLDDYKPTTEPFEVNYR